MTAIEIDDSGVAVRWKLRQGDGWPKYPAEFAVTTDGTTPVAGLITSATVTVRDTFGGTQLGQVTTAEVGSGLALSPDSSTVVLEAGTFDTDAWPLTDVGAPAREQVPCVFDVEVIQASTGDPDTIVVGELVVYPQVTT